MPRTKPISFRAAGVDPLTHALTEFARRSARALAESIFGQHAQLSNAWLEDFIESWQPPDPIPPCRPKRRN